MLLRAFKWGCRREARGIHASTQRVAIQSALCVGFVRVTASECLLVLAEALSIGDCVRRSVVTAMTASGAPFARLDTHPSRWCAREWCLGRMWALSVVGFAIVAWSQATSIARITRELQDMRSTQLQNDLALKAIVQNVSRLQQDLFELSREVDQKADTALVTVLQGEVVQKESAQSVTDVQRQLENVQEDVRQKASSQNLSRLEVVLRGKASVGDVAGKANESVVDNIRAQLSAAEDQLRHKAEKASTPRFADLPVTPNWMQDTEHFRGVCHGRVGVETPWADAWGSPWVSFNERGTVFDAASSTVEVVDMTSEASAERARLWPLGALSASQGGVVQDNFWGADMSALLLTVQTLPVADETAFGAITQNCRLYTSWNVGSFATEIGVFVNVLEYTGNIQFRFASGGDAGAGVLIEGPAAQGWRHLHSSTAGWRGCQQSFFTGEGRIRVAIALPYQSFGNHSGVPVWSGFDPTFFLGNS